MPLESATYINGLNSSNPAGSDDKSQGDDHIRLIKSALKATFPSLTGPVTATDANINDAVSKVVQGLVKLAQGSIAAPGISFAADATSGFSQAAAGQLDGSVGGQQFLHVGSDKAASFKGAVEVLGPFTTSQGECVPTGAALVWFSDVLPTGFLWCNGDQASRTTYANLFAKIGVQYGAGDGSTTFNLPNMQEVVPVGKSNMGGLAAPGRITHLTVNTLGAVVGEEQHTLSTAEMPTHGHATTVTDPGHAHTVSILVPSGTALTGEGASPISQQSVSTSTSTTGINVTVDSTGGGAAHNNVQPSIVVNWIIKT